jgi:hypothetical protein
MVQKLVVACFIISCVLLNAGCQKSLTAGNTSNGTSGIDSTIIAGNGTQLVRLVTDWSLGSAPSTDSSVEQFTYDTAGHVTLSSLGIWGEVAYYRDNNERIIKLGTPQTSYSADSFFTYVQYQSETSTQVLFTVFQNNGSSPQERDSTAFIYSNGRVSQTYLYANVAGLTSLARYQTYSYDANGNLTQLYTYYPNGILDVGSDFTYDSKTNPLYYANDASLLNAWGNNCTPNNVVKQVNHYGNPTQKPDGHFTYAYTYNAKGLPATCQQSVSPLAQGQETSLAFYYYQ